MSTSFLGFNGSEDLGGELSAVFALESFLRIDVGGAGRFPGDTFFARASYVGLKGGFESVTLGRNGTPLFVATLLTNAFGDSFGFSPSIRQLFVPSGRMLPFFGDTAWNNSIAYKSLSLAYDHNLSKRTDVHAVLMNDRQTALSNGNTLAVGIRARF